MKNILYIVIAVALLAIGYKLFLKEDSSKAKTPVAIKQTPANTPEPKVHTGNEPFRIGDGRLKDHPWLRFDGTYKMSDTHATVQYMRFYPEGNVTLISGGEKSGGFKLKDLMAQDTPNGGNANVRNSLVKVSGDSLFFTTKFFKGEIDYKGTFMEGDKETLSFLKHSHINGRKGRFDYTFEAD